MSRPTQLIAGKHFLPLHPPSLSRTSSSQPNSFLLQLFREELERVVGDSMRESGTEGISALLSDVMNIKNGSESFLQKTTLRRSIIELGFMEKQERRIFSPFPVFLCNVYSMSRGLGRVDQGQASSFKANIFENQRQIFSQNSF